jgi:hypothetical protein
MEAIGRLDREIANRVVALVCLMIERKSER